MRAMSFDGSKVENIWAKLASRIGFLSPFCVIWCTLFEMWVHNFCWWGLFSSGWLIFPSPFVYGFVTFAWKEGSFFYYNDQITGRLVPKSLFMMVKFGAPKSKTIIITLPFAVGVLRGMEKERESLWLLLSGKVTHHQSIFIEQKKWNSKWLFQWHSNSFCAAGEDASFHAQKGYTSMCVFHML